MKVAIVVGGRWHAPDVARGLTRLGHEVDLLDPDELRRRHPLAGSAIGFGLSHGGRVPLVMRLASMLFSCWAGLALRKLRPDLILCWTGFALPLALAHRRRMTLIRGSHHVRRQRKLLAGVAGNRDYPRWMDVLHQELEYMLVRRVSVPTAEIAADPFWGKARVSVAPYAKEALGTHVARAPTSSRLKAIFVGEPGYRKGFDLLPLVDASPLVESIAVVGSGRHPRDVELPKAQYFGGVPAAAVPALMAQAHVLVLLSREEGQARVGLEAASVGLPVLTSRRSGLSQLCAAGGGICLAEVTPSTVADGLEHIERHWHEMSRLALEHANSWTWEDHASSLVGDARVVPRG